MVNSRAGSRWVRVVSVLGVLAVAVVLAPHVALAAGACQTTTTSSYAVTICIDTPQAGAELSGDAPVSVSVSVTGTSPGIAKIVTHLDGTYLLTDYSSPYSFFIPTEKFVDGTRTLTAQAILRDGNTSDPASTIVSFQNGNAQPPVNTSSRGPTTGRPAGPGEAFVVAATGDGASGEPNAEAVNDMVTAWDPNLFLYLGDVYEKGSKTEFANWYGSPTTALGRLKGVTNPIVGNHEYEGDTAEGYFDYWDNIPHYYSYDAGGWHFIALDSTSQFGQLQPGSAQYDWLMNDLATNQTPCTLAYWHHPRFSNGPQGGSAATDAVWQLLANHGVEAVLTGHDHSYQRFVPLGANGQPDPNGITEFVAGGGGHGIQTFVGNDSRMAVGFDTVPNAFGALKLSLSPGGASYQYVNTGGNTIDSGTLECGSAPDVTAPSAPAGLVAQVGQGRVDLSWSASTDNVAVAGYQIVRDGVVVDTVGVQTTYADVLVADATSYQYVVRAVDAAGNVSGPSNQVGVTTPAFSPVLFSDGFESGDLGLWSTVTGAVSVGSQVTHSGGFAARASSTGLAAEARATLASPGNDVYYRTWFNVVSQGNNTVYLAKFRTPTDGSILGIYVTSTGKLGFRNDVAGVSSSSTTTVGSGWHELQVRAVTGANGRVETWLDGQPVTALTKDQNLGTNPVGRIQIGDNSAGRTFDVAFDDIIASTQYVTAPPPAPDVTAPSAPAGLVAQVGQGRVDLSWSASTDNVAVAGYQIVRDGVVVDTVGVQTTYADVLVADATSYQYVVRAVDAAGNVSGPSNQVGVTTPAFSPVLFSDGFESGDLGLWSTVTGAVSVGSQVTHSGGFAARASSTGLAAEARATLASPGNDVYYRTWFNVVSQGNNTVYLAKFRTPTDGSILGIYVTSTGKLGFRNDVAGVSSSSTTTVGSGWHELQVRAVTGANGRVETWLDGQPVTALTKDQNLGTNPVGRIQIGDNSAGRTFDVAFDDIIASTQYVTAPPPAPDVTAPSAPAGLVAQVGQGRVDLSWSASTDNVAVAGYQIVRDGVVVDTVGVQTTYADVLVADATSYQYVVRAVDAAGNVSGPSNQVGVTTPAFSPVLFSDGFESGDLGLWSTVTGAVSVGSQVTHSGGFAARASSTGLAAEARATLASPGNDVYYRTWFNVVSQGNNTVYLAKFRTPTDGSILGIYVTSTGKLGFRNDVAGVSSSSTTTVGSGWHELQVRAVTGANGRVETWLDGQPVTALTKDQNLGTNPVGRIQIGDNSAGRTFDVAFDDIIASTQYLGG